MAKTAQTLFGDSAAAWGTGTLAVNGLFMVIPLAGLLVSVRGFGRALALFLSAAGVILAAYFWPFFGSLVPSSASAYLEQPFRAGRGHIAGLHMVFGLVPSVLAGVGAIIRLAKAPAQAGGDVPRGSSHGRMPSLQLLTGVVTARGFRHAQAGVRVGVDHCGPDAGRAHRICGVLPDPPREDASPASAEFAG